jgi:hypothetical protein
VVRGNVGLIWNIEELINITGTVLNNKPYYLIPPTALQPYPTLCFP